MYGGCSQELGHFNPQGVDHGGPTSSERHVGDFGNIDILNNAFTGTLVDTVASLYGQNSILGEPIRLLSALVVAFVLYFQSPTSRFARFYIQVYYNCQI